MQQVARGGLTGKARHHRHRNRAYRLYTQQMLEEYLEDELGPAPARPVPLRGRAEFLPTVDHWTEEDAPVQTQGQLQFEIPKPTPQAEQPTESTAPAQPTVKVFPEPYWARPRAAFQEQRCDKMDRDFDLRRFGFGCALGGAMAAAILLAVSIVF